MLERNARTRRPSGNNNNNRGQYRRSTVYFSSMCAFLSMLPFLLGCLWRVLAGLVCVPLLACAWATSEVRGRTRPKQCSPSQR